ncbi:BTAD domain-containing putative transcriptional regulator [Amycolatopsis sp. NPDC059021]|uniref:AfsR/SARP family transcriptional regulator n=1 Tax=Amycolatopsis sp. NPDC059021 TaxID=3346704 RepID=UPI0036716C73
MKLRVLGPVEAVREGELVPLGGQKPRTLLAALLLAEEALVTSARLIDVIWDEEAPATASASLHTYVSSLRKALPEVGIVTRPGGYQLILGESTLDYREFTRLAKEGRTAAAAGDHKAAKRYCELALATWGGLALTGLSCRFATTSAARLESLKLAVIEARFDACLALGLGDELVDELTTLVAEHGLLERLRGQLMLALHQAGRQADALACYQAGRQLLVDQLGVEPGPELQEVHRQVLHGIPPTLKAEAVPGQLPLDMADFTGRAKELRRLRESTAQVVVVAGKPGSGKTALAVRASHGLAGRYPDGQLYIDLQGVHGTAVEASEALGRFLRALGVPDSAVASTVEERAAQYRSLLASRAVLVVLDDAANEQQVRALLPGGRRCACLVTSRRRLDALAGAEHVDLGIMDEADCLTLLGRIIGEERMVAHRDAAEEIVRQCGRLPLAIRIAGGRLAARPDLSLARMAARLREQRRVLDELAVGDLEVRGSMALSYDSLGPAERRALRWLAWLGAPELGIWLVAAALDTDDDTAEVLLDTLVRAQLLDVVGDRRYRMHTLVGVFAWERAEAEDERATLETAAERAAHRAFVLVETASGGTPMRVLKASRPDGEQPDHEQLRAAVGAHPLAWFDLEQATLVHLVERAGDLGLAAAAARLASALCASLFVTRNHFDQWWRTHHAALEATKRAHDFSGQGLLLTGLGWLRGEQDRLDEAADYYHQALQAYDQVNDLDGAAVTRVMLGSVLREQGHLAEALMTVDEALPRLNRVAEARARHCRGLILTELGKLDEALRECIGAHNAYHDLRDRHGVALVSRTIGLVHRAAGRLPEAAEACEEALQLLAATGDRLMTAYAVQALVKVRIRQGTAERENDRLLEALQTCSEMKDGFGQALVLRTLGEWELALGTPEAALDYLRRSLNRWGQLRLPLWRARTLRSRAIALSVLGKNDEAESAWSEAESIFAAHGSREAGEPRPPGLAGRSSSGALSEPS